MVNMAKKIRWNSSLTWILIVSFSALLLNVCSSFWIIFSWSFYWDLLTRFYLRVAAESNKSRGLMYCHLLTCPSYFIPGDCRLLWHFLWQRLQHQGKQQRQQPGHLTETQLRSHFRVFLLPKAAASNQRTSFPTADISIYPAGSGLEQPKPSFESNTDMPFWFHVPAIPQTLTAFYRRSHKFPSLGFTNGTMWHEMICFIIKYSTVWREPQQSKTRTRRQAF